MCTKGMDFLTACDPDPLLSRPVRRSKIDHDDESTRRLVLDLPREQNRSSTYDPSGCPFVPKGERARVIVIAIADGSVLRSCFGPSETKVSPHPFVPIIHKRNGTGEGTRKVSRSFPRDVGGETPSIGTLVPSPLRSSRQRERETDRPTHGGRGAVRRFRRGSSRCFARRRSREGRRRRRRRRRSEVERTPSWCREEKKEGSIGRESSGPPHHGIRSVSRILSEDQVLPERSDGKEEERISWRTEKIRSEEDVSRIWRLGPRRSTTVQGFLVDNRFGWTERLGIGNDKVFVTTTCE